MTVAKTRRKKTAAQRLWSLHWLMAACYLLLFSGGAYMASLSLAYTFLAFVVLHSADQRKYLRATLRRFYKAAINVIASR